MARGLCKLQVIGNVGRDAELKYTPEGKARTEFSMAVNQGRRKPDGSTAEETLWLRVICWSKLAEIADLYVKKGTKVYVEGRLQIRTFTGRDGKERTAVEVVASDMVLLSARDEAREPAAVGARTAFVADDDVPF